LAKFYVTTAIPYVNAPPHVGNAIDFTCADVLARYHRQRGDDVVFSTGTDEHGGKNAEAAAKVNLTPKKYVDNLSENFKNFAQALDISYDRFIRTTDQQHVAGAKAIWKKLKPHIYRGKYAGMYDQKEEEFITNERAREIKQHEPERYARLQKTTEENYFFKLSGFNDQIAKAINDGRFNIVPATRKHEILSLLKDGLEDISISRPKSKVGWGIPVPDDPDQTIYVWFEALMNYITVLAYPKADDLKKYWPADVQVIGKDILRFHAAIWPAMLLALKLDLPKNLYVHGFVTVANQKMSKSIGNTVSPLEVISKFGSDAMRYYFLRHIPSYDDGDFSWDKMEQAYNGELGNELGNLVQRIASMLNRYQDGVIGEIPPGEHDTGPYYDSLSAFRFDKALDYVFTMIRGQNQYIDEEKPWEIAKQDKEHLKEVLAYSTGSLLQIGSLIEPFLPRTGQAIADIFSGGVVKNYDGPLFPRIELSPSQPEA